MNTWEYDCSLYLSFCDNTEYAWFAEVCKKSCGKCGMQIDFCDGINVNVKNIRVLSIGIHNLNICRRLFKFRWANRIYLQS